MGSFKKAPKMSKIRDNPFYFIFLSLISSGVKQLPVSYGLILINFASFLVNAAQYILIIGSYLYTSYSNWSLRRLRRRVDDFMNTKGTSTISDVDLDSAIRLTQSQILSSLRESGHLTGHFVQGQQQGHSQQQVEMTQGQFYTEQQQILQQRATQHRDGTQTQQSAMTQQSTMSPVMTQQTMSFQQTSQPTQVPQQQASQPRLRKSQPPQSRLDRNQPVQKHQSNSSQSRDRIQSQDRQVINRTPSKYVTEPRIHSSRSVIESSIDSLCSERSDINKRPGSLSGHSRSNDQIPLQFCEKDIPTNQIHRFLNMLVLKPAGHQLLQHLRSMQCPVYRLKFLVRIVAQQYEILNPHWLKVSLEKLLKALKKSSLGLHEDLQFRLQLQVQICTIEHFLKTPPILQDPFFSRKGPVSKWILSA